MINKKWVFIFAMLSTGIYATNSKNDGNSQQTCWEQIEKEQKTSTSFVNNFVKLEAHTLKEGELSDTSLRGMYLEAMSEDGMTIGKVLERFGLRDEKTTHSIRVRVDGKECEVALGKWYTMGILDCNNFVVKSNSGTFSRIACALQFVLDEDKAKVSVNIVDTSHSTGFGIVNSSGAFLSLTNASNSLFNFKTPLNKVVPDEVTQVSGSLFYTVPFEDDISIIPLKGFAKIIQNKVGNSLKKIQKHGQFVEISNLKPNVYSSYGIPLSMVYGSLKEVSSLSSFHMPMKERSFPSVSLEQPIYGKDISSSKLSDLVEHVIRSYRFFSYQEENNKGHRIDLKTLPLLSFHINEDFFKAGLENFKDSDDFLKNVCEERNIDFDQVVGLGLQGMLSQLLNPFFLTQDSVERAKKINETLDKSALNPQCEKCTYFSTLISGKKQNIKEKEGVFSMSSFLKYKKEEKYEDSDFKTRYIRDENFFNKKNESQFQFMEPVDFADERSIRLIDDFSKIKIKKEKKLDVIEEKEVREEDTIQVKNEIFISKNKENIPFVLIEDQKKIEKETVDIDDMSFEFLSNNKADSVANANVDKKID